MGLSVLCVPPCQESSEQIARIVEQLEFNGGTGAFALDPFDS